MHLSSSGMADLSATHEFYLTADVPGIGGRLKDRPEDFLVEEIPAYEPCGEGEHLYLLVEKRNHATLSVVRMLADHFGVRRDAVGFAGLKDKVAITRQLFSIHVPGKKAEDFPLFEREGVTIHWVDKHSNKLRRGHLVGNRFIVRVRGVEPSKIVMAHRSLSILGRLGVPNRIGEQRFGILQNNHLIGRALIMGDHQAIVDELLGPSQLFPKSQDEARRLYTEGKYLDAMGMLPRSLHTERRVLASLARGAKPKNAIGAIERMQVSFYITALQSAVFNRVLDWRLNTSQDSGGGIGVLHAGDLAFKHDSGAVFAVTDEMRNASADAAQSLARRAAEFEISPSGPMWGHRMMRPTEGGTTDKSEVAALMEYGLTVEDLNRYAAKAWDPEPGERRPLRVRLTQPDVEAGVDEHGAYIKCVFELPRGSFATTVMRELMKPGRADGATTRDEDDEESDAR